MGFVRKKILGVIDIDAVVEGVKSWCRQTFSVLGHKHDKSDVTDFAHTHAISEVTNLTTTLNGKAATNHTHSTYAAKSHTHTTSQITDFNSGVGLPDYANSVTTTWTNTELAGSTFTATANGYLIITGSNTDNGGLRIYINDVLVWNAMINADNHTCTMFIVSENDSVRASSINAANTPGSFTFIPFK